MSKTIKLRFLQATELAGVGYSPVGGPAKDGVYGSVPVASIESDASYEALVQAGLIEQLGDGDDSETPRVDGAEQGAFKASGLSETDWLSIPPVDRGQLVAHQRQAEEDSLRDDVSRRNAEASAKGPEVLAADTAAQNEATRKAAEAAEAAAKAPTDDKAKEPAAKAPAAKSTGKKQ